MKPNCNKHIVPEYLSNLNKVAIDIADMPYDKLSEFLNNLSIKILKDSEKDLAGGREKLAKKLESLSLSLEYSKTKSDDAWKICKPYMK